VWWGICILLCYKFPNESNSERILKIGQYLVKLWAIVRCLVFFDSLCREHSIIPFVTTHSLFSKSVIMSVAESVKDGSSYSSSLKWSVYCKYTVLVLVVNVAGISHAMDATDHADAECRKCSVYGSLKVVGSVTIRLSTYRLSIQLFLETICLSCTICVLCVDCCRFSG